MVSGSIPDRDVAAVESFVADWLAEEGIPGAALAVVDGDDVVYSEGFGARDLEENEPATPDTLFGVGSCTKSFTAAAVMQLVERGDLALDDAVADYLPHLDGVPGDPVTVEELLTHTSGLPSDEIAGPLVSRSLGLGVDPIPLSSDADLRRHVQGSLDRRVTDRDAFFYYNTGYTLLALLVEELAGTPFADYVTANVLEPAGLTRATFHEDDFESEDDRMTPYVDGEDGQEPVSFPFDRHVHGAGGLLASVRELADVVRLYLGDGTVDGETVLSPESVAAMETPAGEFGSYLDGRSVGYGYGLMVEDYLDDSLVGHGGDVAVSTAWFGFLEDAERGVAVACNVSPETHPAEVGMGVLAILDDEAPESVQPHYRLQAALDAATGEYAGYRDVTSATVERVGGSLRLEVDADTGAEELLLTPETVGADELVCTTVLPDGFEREARFDLDSDPIECFFHSLRLHATD